MARLTVRVIPRAAREAVGAPGPDGVLAVRVTAPPADGAANVAVSKLLARTLGIPQRDVVLVTGATARVKVFELPLDEAEIRRRLT